MNYQDNEFERRAEAQINKLKQEYVIDLGTGQRLQDILVYLYLSEQSKNRRGIALQTENLKNLLHTCPKITVPVFSVQSPKSAYIA